jgi:eukaryotic-like serine/threonine-protein kinase
VKPANVLLTDDGRAVLTDFGIATVDSEGFVTRSGLVLGSPEFIAPERARDGTAGTAADLWSLGATLYFAVEGRSPYQRASVVETLAALAADGPDPPRRAGPLGPILQGLLQKNPASRTKLAETERRLRGVLTGEPAPPPTPWWRWPWRTSRHREPEGVSAPPAPHTKPPAPQRESPAPRPTPPAPRRESPAPRPTPPAPRRESPAPRPTPPAPRRESPAPRPTPPAPKATPAAAGTVVRGTRQRDRRRWALITAGLALAIVAATWPAIRSGPGDAGWHSPGQAVGPTPVTPSSAASADTGSESPAPPAPTTGAPAPDVEAPGAGQAPGLQRPALPAGWLDYRDPTGFSLYVPAGWNRSRESTMVYFRDPVSGRVLGIDQTRQPKPDPVADWRGQANYRVARGDFPGYQEIRIVAVPYWQRAADWEFTFNGRVRQHVNNRGFITSASQAYGIYWQTNDSDWEAARRDLELIFDSFRPAPGR